MLSNRVMMATTAAPAMVNYFGDGSDGDVTISSNTELSVAQDGGPLVKHYNTLTIDSSCTLTTNNRCKGLLAYVKGNCTINGTLSMSKRGASATPSDKFDISRWQSGGAGSGEAANAFFSDESNQPTTDGTGAFTLFDIPQAGANGGDRESVGDGDDGDAGANGQTGGGGQGGIQNADGYWAKGSAGTCFSGGSGGGGAFIAGDLEDTRAFAYGGAGGHGADTVGACGGACGGSGGGAGNPGGVGGSGSNGGAAGDNGEDGTGGILYLVVGGNLTFGSSSEISADGANGGNANGSVPSGYGTGGGGSGGGSIVILYAGTLTDNGVDKHADGGLGGSGYSTSQDGGNGGAGSIQGPIQIISEYGS